MRVATLDLSRLEGVAGEVGGGDLRLMNDRGLAAAYGVAVNAIFSQCDMGGRRSSGDAGILVA